MVGFDAPCFGLRANRLDCCSNNSAHEEDILHRCLGRIFMEVAVVVTVRVNGPRFVLRGIGEIKGRWGVVLTDDEIEVTGDPGFRTSMSDVCKKLDDKTWFAIEGFVELGDQCFSLGDAVGGSLLIGEGASIITRHGEVFSFDSDDKQQRESGDNL